jgi:hypothetical protein
MGTGRKARGVIAPVVALVNGAFDLLDLEECAVAEVDLVGPVEDYILI